MAKHLAGDEAPEHGQRAEVGPEFVKRLQEFIETDVPPELLSLAERGASVSEAGAAVAAAFRVVADELEKDTRGDR